MHTCRNPLHCIVPPYMVEKLAENPDKAVRDRAMRNLALSAAARAQRATLALLPFMAAIPSPNRKKHRLTYDAKQGTDLPATLVRSEGEADTGDAAVNEAHNYAGATYDFYSKHFGRNSLDDNGMSLISTVHYGTNYNNAFWNGEQMAYGDGDNVIFQRFTKALDVVGHELTHGVVTFTSNLVYRNEPGALNEHFADVFGVLIRQSKKKMTLKSKGAWLIGADCIVQASTRRALRDMSENMAFQNDPYLGDDPQPKHISNKYTGQADHGGVHINSGIPNHAFYHTALQMKGKPWEKPGLIWYRTLLKLTTNSQFQECAETTYEVATSEFGANSNEAKAVKLGWGKVGISV